jgi:hypothetical protein
MVRTLIKKVRKLIQGDKAKKPAKAPKADAVVEEKPAAPAPVPVAPAEAAPAAERHPARRSRPAPAAGHAPEPLRQAKERRVAVKEEWRPGQKKEGDAPRDARRSGLPANRAPKDAPRLPREPRAPRAEGDAPRSHRPRREGPAKPSDRSDMSDKSDKSSGNTERPRRPRRPREEGERPAHSPQRGKGFSFPRPKPPHGDWDRGAHEVPAAEGKTRFADLGLPDELLHAVTDLGYQYCTPIQAGILPALLDGRDGIGQAQTGTGKTAAFLMASFARMMRNPLADPKPGTPRMLIIAPTRELVLQIEEEAATLAKYTPIQSLPVYGGLDYEPQKDALRHNVIDLVVATPGRLIDFLRSRVVDLSQVETLVLDEADRMLDMGFIPDVKRIVQSTPHKDKRQTLFFSATFTDEVRRLAQSWTNNPMEVNIAPTSVAADTVDQTVYIVTDDDKFPLVVNLLRNLTALAHADLLQPPRQRAVSLRPPQGL